MSVFPRMGVWWDLHTCPVPAGFDTRLVRGSIESAIKRILGPCRVTVFAVGNLEDVLPSLLEEISSSGILLRHTPAGGLEIHELILKEWKPRHPPGTSVMYISSDTAWFNSSFSSMGYNVYRAYDGPPLQFLHCPTLKVWGWQSLLKEYSHFEITSQVVLDEDQSAFLCFQCNIPCQSFADLIKHLKSEEHIQELLDLVPSYQVEDENWIPTHFCQVCKHAAYSSYMMDIHNNSQVHAQKVLEQASPS